MPCCTCWRSRGASACRSRSTISIASVTIFRCWSISMPSGQFLMEDFYYAGGIPAVMRELADVIHRDALTVNGKTMGENTADAPCWNREVDPERAQSHSRARRDGRAARQPGARRGGDQAFGRHAAAAANIAAAPWYSKASRISRRASTSRISRSTKPP